MAVSKNKNQSNSQLDKLELNKHQQGNENPVKSISSRFKLFKHTIAKSLTSKEAKSTPVVRLKGNKTELLKRQSILTELMQSQTIMENKLVEIQTNFSDLSKEYLLKARLVTLDFSIPESTRKEMAISYLEKAREMEAISKKASVI